MAGLSIEEACGDGWINGLHPEDRSSVLSAWQQMVKSEGHWGLEYRFRTPSGKVTWVYGLATPQRDAKGNIVGYIGINTDITQRKQEEERLKLYEKIVSSAPDAISFLDKNYRYILVNDAYEKFSGVQREEFLGLTVPEYLGVNAFELHVKPNFDKCLQGETVTYDEWFDYPILGRRFVAVTYFPFCDTSGSIIGVVSNTKDITDWKHAQEALWESQEHYRSLAEDMPVYISSFLPDGTLTYVNNALAAVVDVSPKDMIGLSFFNMCDPEDMVMIKERLQSLTPENPTETHEQTNVDEDGSMKCLLWTNRAFFDENGRTIRFQAIGQDISEHRKIEHALKLSEEKFSKAFHLSPDAVNINRLKDGCYVDINLGFTDIMGYTREDVVGRSSLPGDIGLWVNVEDRNRLIEGLRNTSEVVGLEAQFRKKDGSIIIGLMSARIIEIEGEQCIISISRDITDRKRMEEELREAAMRQQAAVQAGNIGLWDWDLTTNKVTYSPEWKRQIGYEPDEISDDFDEWQSRVHPDDIGLITSQVNTYIAEARHYYQIEFRFRHKDGSYRWISAQGSVTINDTGHPIRVIGAHVDITERMRAKESLQESESRLRDIIFSVGDWVWEVDKNGVYTYSSQKGIDLFGRTSDDIIGMTPFSFMAPDEIKRVAPIFSEILLNKAPIKDLENWNITKDGERVCLLTNGVPVLDENGNLVGYRGVDKDITERKLTEQALRESEEKFAKVFRDAPVLIAISDIADGTYLEVNEYALQVSGFTCDEVIGHTSVEIGWLTAERRTLIVKEIQNKGRISDLEIDFHAKDGRVLHGLLNGEQITIGERLCLLQIAVDITERKQAEEALASSQAELKAIYDHAPVMMCVVDEDRRLIYANQPFVDFTRASEDDLIGGVACGVFGCINATDDARGCGFGDDCQNCTLWLAIDDTIKTGIAHHNVEQQATWMCDDERRNVTLLGFTTLIQSVGQKRALLCIQDITERKKQEETLIFHSMVLDQIQDQVTATDLDGVISYVNQAQEKALGVPIESLIGQSTTIFGDDPERGATQQEITETTLREGSWRGEVVNFTADGKELFMDCRTQVVHDANGKPFALCGIATDITERVQAEENRKTLVEMLDSAPGAITVHDTNGRFLYTNRNNLEIHGYTECEFIALNLHELDVPESEALLEERFRLIYEKGETSFEVSHYRKDGSIFPLMVYTKTVNWQGNLAILSIATDITERKLAEKALRESEERLKDIIFSIGDWVWEVDENGIYRYTSQRGIDLFGRSIDDVIGKTPFSFMPTDELKRIAPIFSELMAKRAPIKDLENWNLTKNGERVCLLTNAVPILDENGNFKGYRGVDKDITEKKQAEQEVYNNRLLLRTVLDIVPAHICAKNLEGRFVLVNKKLTDFYKTTVDEMTGILHSEICEDEQELKAMLAADREVIESGVQMLIPEETMQNPDGTISYLETYKLPFIANGEQAVLIVASDITQRKIAELALQDSENHYRSLVNNTPDTIMRFDRQHRHLFVNSSVENVTSITPESFIGKTHREMGFPEDLCKYWEEELDTVLQTGTPYETEFIFESQNGPRVLDWRLVPERAVSGEIESILSVSRDITDQRKVEQDYRMLFREMLDGFAVHEIICDKSGNPFDYRFLAVNPAFEQMTGLNALDTIGRTVKELMPGTEQHWIDIYGRVALSGEPVFFENYSSELHKHFEVTAFRPAPNQFACIFVDTTERKHVEQEKRQFYRDTIKSVTQGKLDLVSFEDIEVYVDPSGFLASIESPVDIAIARSKTMEFCKSRGLDNNGIGLFESAVGEAMTNATKHADGCKVYAGVNGNNIWVAVSDTGKGISTMLLPGATLRKGYSSKISMGMGYTIMMEATDNIMLCTGTEGTTVVLSVNVSSSMPALSLDDFPDTWDEISND
jgi:PAS domain S-box-containing protein